MSHLLDEEYLAWLQDHVKLDVKGREYWSLLRKMYQTEFIWFVPNDDNRVGDGLDLRHDFAMQYGVDDEDWLQLGCSFLEMLVALANRYSFEGDINDPSTAFWQLVNNLELNKYTDSYCRPRLQKCEDEIKEILDTVIWRLYDEDGVGGIFPLRHGASEDQRKVEIWYQMHNYILDM